MIIKTYTAESAAAALKMVRTELGRDAVVLKTRELPGAPAHARIEVTACTEKAIAPTVTSAPATQVAAPKKAAPRPFVPAAVTNRLETKPAIPATANITPAPVDTAMVQRLDQIETKLARLIDLAAASTPDNSVADMRESLRDADVPSALVQELCSALSSAGVDQRSQHSAIRTLLTEKLGPMISAPLSFKPGDRLLFGGPAGAGKTSAFGKLAARLVFQEKQKVTLVTLDTVKVGAFEEIQSYGDIIDSPAVAYQTAGMELDPESIVLIDTPSVTRQLESHQTLRAQIETLKPNYRFAVYSALMRSGDIAGFTPSIKTIDPTHIIMTMTDLTERWGGLMAACRETTKPIAFLTNSPAGMGTLNVPDAALIVRSLLKTEESRG